MTIDLAPRVTGLKPSSTVAVTNRAKQMRAEGVDVLSFAAGEPDFDTPEPIKQAAIDALRAGQTKYVPTLGDAVTRSAVAEKFAHENKIPGLTGEHVAISAGGKHSLYLACQCLLRPGDDVLLPTPAWVSFAPNIRLAGADVVELPTSTETDFKITPEQLRAAITPRSRLLILNSPSNPCGTMYSPAELDALAEVVAEAARSTAPGLHILSDELYEKIVYGGVEHKSIGSNPKVAERTITIGGLSKAWAMTGWRVGFCVMPGENGLALVRAIGKLQGQMTTNITSFVYPAIRTALTDCAEDVERMRAAFASRARLVHDRVSALPGVTCPKPTGAFYVFPDVSAQFGKTSPKGATINSALDFAEALLDEHSVALVPGEDFLGPGAKHVRLSFACSEGQINAGIDRLSAFLDSLR